MLGNILLFIRVVVRGSDVPEVYKVGINSMASKWLPNGVVIKVHNCTAYGGKRNSCT